MISLIITVIIVAIAIYSYVIYGIEIHRRNLRPRAATWLIWAVLGTGVSLLQLEHGAGLGAVVTIIAAVANYILAGMAWYYGHRTVHRIDILSSLAALGVFILWWVTADDALTIVFATITYLFGFVPTFERSYRKPYSENMAPFVASVLKYSLSLLVIQQLNIETALYPVTLALYNVIFILMILARRRKKSINHLQKTRRSATID